MTAAAEAARTSEAAEQEAAQQEAEGPEEQAARTSEAEEQEQQAGWKSASRPWTVACRRCRWRSRRPAWHSDRKNWQKTPRWWRRPYTRWGGAAAWSRTEEEASTHDSSWSDRSGGEEGSHSLSSSKGRGLTAGGAEARDVSGEQPTEKQFRERLLTRKELVRAARDACDAQSKSGRS